MAKITSMSEPWNRHNYPEVEEFIKKQIAKRKEDVEFLYYTNTPEKMPLTFEVREENTVIRIFSYDDNEVRTIEVSKDGGDTWVEHTSSPEGDIIVDASMHVGDKILIRGDNTAMGYYNEDEGGIVNALAFYSDGGGVYVYGNVMSILSKDGFAELDRVGAYALASLFFDYNSGDGGFGFYSHPDMRLVLPATTLAMGCYRNMFQGCTSLVTAPALPATTLAENCYNYMFQDCTSLVTAPALPATTLANNCYSGMFSGCTSLVTAPALPATTLAESCYGKMFFGCTSLTTAPSLPATTLAQNCYNSMFFGCTSLTTAPALPATTLAQACYNTMFNGCTNLSYIKAMFTTTPGSSYTKNWVKNVKSTGTFAKNSAATWNVSGVDGIPSGWTVETADS